MPSDRLDVARGLPRWATFGAVAALGFGVQITVILLLTSTGVHIGPATAAAVFAAILHNFTWHEWWTWADRRTSIGAGARLLRVMFSTGLVSLAGTVGLTTWWVTAAGTTAVTANLLAVGVVGIVNYLLLDRMIYRRESEDTRHA